MSMDERTCGICGRLHEHYGGIHEANMLDFRWKGFAHDSVSVERFDLCPECRDAVRRFLRKRHDESAKKMLRELHELMIAHELEDERRAEVMEMRNDAILDAYADNGEPNNKE